MSKLSSYVKGDALDLSKYALKGNPGVYNYTIITLGMAYLMWPLDAIPDFVPVAGYMDDGVVLKMVFDSMREEVRSYMDKQQT